MRETEKLEIRDGAEADKWRNEAEANTHQCIRCGEWISGDCDDADGCEDPTCPEIK